MRNLTNKVHVNHILLFVVLLVAAILRFWNFPKLPFMYDELSALIRSHGNSFSEVIQKAKETDVHPVGVSVFVHYWSLLFGTSEMAVKLPFMLCSIVSIYYIFKIASQWFNATVGLLTATCIATLQFMVMYGQVERPYASGILLCTLMVWCWSNFLFGEQIKKNKYLVGYALTSALCAYNHYFSLLFAVIVGLTGLFFLTKQNFLKYLLAGASAALLFIPHLSIFIYHFSMGGMGEDNWLQKPHLDWLLWFLRYLFHYSGLVYVVIILLILLSILYFRKENTKLHKMHLIAFIFGLSSFLIMFFYSIYKSPVLQFSSMAFSLPFLLMFLFSLFPDVSNGLKTLLVLTLVTINTFTLITVRKHFTVFYKQPYQQMAETGLALVNQLGEKSTSIALNVVDGFMDYYFEKHKQSFHFYNAKINDSKAFRTFVNEQTSACFVAGHLPLEYIEIVKETYPYLIQKEDAYSCSIYCFSKQKPANELHETLVFAEENNIENRSGYWAANSVTPIKNNNEHAYYKLDSTIEYGPNFTTHLKNIINDKNNIITVKAILHSPDTTANPVLVMDIHDGDKSISWNGAEYFWYNNLPKDKNSIYVSLCAADLDLRNRPDAVIKIYIWNRNKKEIFINSIRIEVVEGNPFVYGIYQPIR
jgi:uncharacterized membrane protein